MKFQTAKGAVLMVGCMAIMGLIDNYVKVIAGEAGLWQFHFVRSAIVCAILFVVTRIMGWPLMPRNPWGVGLRSVMGAISMGIYFGALAFLPISQVGAGLFTSPIFVLLFSVVLFGHNIGIWRILAAFIGFIGVLLVLQLNFATLDWVVLVPIFAGVSWALTALSTREYCTKEDTISLLFWFFGALGVLGALGLLFFGLTDFGDDTGFVTRGWTTPSQTFWLWTGIQAVGSLVGVGMLTRAYQIGETSYIAVFEYSFLVFAGGWAFVLWGETLNWVGLLGICAIILSGAVIALRSSDA